MFNQVATATFHEVSDTQLMTLVGSDDLGAFASLYDRFCDRAYRVAWTVCRNQSRAEDAVQEAFLSIWKARAKYREELGTVAAWLLTVVRRRAIDLMRRESAHSESDDDALLEAYPAREDVHADAVRHDDARRLAACITRLPESQQAVITLAFYGQLTHTEIANQLDLPCGTVKGRMRLGLQKLNADFR